MGEGTSPLPERLEELERKLGELARRVELATTAEAILARAGLPLPPPPRQRDRHGLRAVRP